MSVNIRMRLDDYLARSPSPIDAQREDTLVSLLRSQAVGTTVEPSSLIEPAR